jgi:hypothetical protein
VRGTCHPFVDGVAVESAEPREAMWGLGRKAHESFLPHPDTGKGLVKVQNPNGTQPLNPNSNWALFLKSLYDVGLPEGVFVNDLTVLDGIHLRTELIDEPEERKNFKSQSVTGDVQEAPRAPGKIAVAAEILEGGAPWDGGGGFAEAEEAPKPTAKKTAAPVAKVAPKLVTKKAPEPEPEPEEEAAEEEAAEESGVSEDVMEAALEGMAEVMRDKAKAKGSTRVMFKTGMFKAVTAKHGEDMAQAVQGIWEDPATIATVLGEYGMKLVGTNIVPVK